MSTPKEIFEEMKKRLEEDPSKVAGVNAVYQFIVDGENGGKWYADLTGEKPAIVEGEHSNPNVTIMVGDEDFVKIKSGQMSGQMAFMTGKLKIKGDMGLAMKLQKLLGS